MKPRFTLLKHTKYPEKNINFLISKEWETRPGMDLDWIISSIDSLYILYLEKEYEIETIIGFMVHSDMRMYYYELLPMFRNNGYSRTILESQDIQKVYCYKELIPFWSKIYDDIEYVCLKYTV